MIPLPTDYDLIMSAEHSHSIRINDLERCNEHRKSWCRRAAAAEAEVARLRQKLTEYAAERTDQ